MLGRAHALAGLVTGALYSATDGLGKMVRTGGVGGLAALIVTTGYALSNGIDPTASIKDAFGGMVSSDVY